MREPELLKALQTRWAAIDTTGTLLPGGLHEFQAESDNIPNKTRRPKYGIVTITENPIARQTNGGPIREHIINVEVKATDGLTANASLMHSLSTVPTGMQRVSLDNGGTLIDMYPHNSKQGTTPDTRGMKPVAGLSVAWRVQSRWDN